MRATACSTSFASARAARQLAARTRIGSRDGLGAHIRFAQAACRQNFVVHARDRAPDAPLAWPSTESVHAQKLDKLLADSTKPAEFYKAARGLSAATTQQSVAAQRKAAVLDRPVPIEAFSLKILGRPASGPCAEELAAILSAAEASAAEVQTGDVLSLRIKQLQEKERRARQRPQPPRRALSSRSHSLLLPPPPPLNRPFVPAHRRRRAVEEILALMAKRLTLHYFHPLEAVPIAAPKDGASFEHLVKLTEHEMGAITELEARPRTSNGPQQHQTHKGYPLTSPPGPSAVVSQPVGAAARGPGGHLPPGPNPGRPALPRRDAICILCGLHLLQDSLVRVLGRRAAADEPRGTAGALQAAEDGGGVGGGAGARRGAVAAGAGPEGGLPAADGVLHTGVARAVRGRGGVLRAAGGQGVRGWGRGGGDAGRRGGYASGRAVADADGDAQDAPDGGMRAGLGAPAGRASGAAICAAPPYCMSCPPPRAVAVG